MDYSHNSLSNGLYCYTGALDESNVVHQDEQLKQLDVPLTVKSLIVKSQENIDSLSGTLKLLKVQLKHLLTKWENASEMNQIACNFVKRPGQVYHLYYQNHKYFSMLSPEEWGCSGPLQIYIGSYKLELDYSWTCVRSNVYA